MRILVSNDDGIDAPGLKALAEVLAEQHEVYVVAPYKERSAMGHALTLHKPLRIDPVPVGTFKGVKEAFSVEGTPTDCIKIAISSIFSFTPDLIVSGINHGPNMGHDILYSGTVSVAIEGCMYGIKSIAFSLSDYRADGFEEPASFVPEVLEFLNQDWIPWAPKSLFNVNLPAAPKDKVHGIALTSLGRRMYSDVYIKRIDPRGRYYYWLSGDLLKSDMNPDSDIMKCKDGFISVTPITFEMTNFDMLESMKKELWKREKRGEDVGRVSCSTSSSCCEI